MTEVTFGDLTFNIRRSSRRKTVQISIERDGQLVIATPIDTTLETIERIVNSRKLWIYSKLAGKEPLIEYASEKQFVAGESFYYLGRSYRLKIVERNGDILPLRLHDDYFEIQDLSNAPQLFQKWYSIELNAVIDELVKRFNDRIGVKPGEIRIRDLGYKWGTCGKKGDLYFHWRTAMLPMKMIVYIVIHELVHLLEPRHNNQFWERIDMVIPDYGERVQWLAENGVEYNL